MVDSKRGRGRNQWQGVIKAILFLIVAVIITFAASGAASMSSQEVISLNVTQMDLQDVLRLIAEKADLNIIISKEVVGSVTIRLKNVGLWQALEAVLEMSGFTYREEKGIVRVLKLEGIIEEKPMLTTEIIPLNYAKAEEMKKASQHLLSPSGTMEIDIRSNVLVITDASQNIERIRQLVVQLDTGVPVFELTGILSGPDYALAMINNKILKVGEMIRDFTVSQIGKDNVTLKKEDQTLVLKLREGLRGLESTSEEVVKQGKRNYEAEIKVYAKKKWPDDYEMQVYEYNNQIKALNQIRNLPSTTDYNESILWKAMAEWEEDYEMVIYEYNNQLEAYKKMR